MERELWPPLYRVVRAVGKDFRQKYVSFQPWVVAVVFLWAALHDRPVSWACQARHWSTTRLRPLRVPSAATLSRRADGLAVGALLRAVEQRLRAQGEPRLLSLLDGKPLPVSNVSKDKDARRGRGAGGMAKGYKLHTLWSGRPLPEAWEITPLNEAESVVAQRLVRQAPGAGYLLADGNYDSGPLSDEAAQQGYQLLTPLPENAGHGHRRQSPARLRSRDLWQGAFGRSLYESRGQIERDYGAAVSFAGGLAALPAWVRGRERVRSWVWGKLLINAVRIRRLAAAPRKPAPARPTGAAAGAKRATSRWSAKDLRLPLQNAGKRGAAVTPSLACASG
jgi:IS5 family transposase